MPIKEQTSLSRASELPTTLMIIGASVRAAAESAVRAGYRVIAFDLFADRDLAKIARCFPIPGPKFPAVVVNMQRSLRREIPWMFTGGLENHLAVVEAIGRCRPLLGPTSDQITQVRNRQTLSRIAAAASWNFPQTVPVPSANDKLIFRPADHCGGLGIRLATSIDLDPSVPLPGSGKEAGVGSGSPSRLGAWEEFVPGPTYAAAFVADGNQVRLLGVTSQVLARDLKKHVLHSSHPFAYTGSVGPLPLTDAQRRSWVRLGQHITNVTRLKGVFGVDAIFDVADRRWTMIEINPRYTASMELIERTTDQSIVDIHVRACLGILGNEVRSEFCASPEQHAKRILFAPYDIQVSTSLGVVMDQMRDEADHWYPWIADLPRVGQHIRRGRPIVTVFGHGVDRQSASALVQQRVRRLLRRLPEVARSDYRTSKQSE